MNAPMLKPAAPRRAAPQVLRVDTPPTFTVLLPVECEEPNANSGFRRFQLTLLQMKEHEAAIACALRLRPARRAEISTVFGIVAHLVCEDYDIRLEQLTQRLRGRQRVALARMTAMTLMREMSDGARPLFSLSDIGDAFRRDHSSVLSAARKIHQEEEVYPEVRARLQELRRRVAEAMQRTT